MRLLFIVILIIQGCAGEEIGEKWDISCHVVLSNQETEDHLLEVVDSGIIRKISQAIILEKADIASFSIIQVQAEPDTKGVHLVLSKEGVDKIREYLANNPDAILAWVLNGDVINISRPSLVPNDGDFVMSLKIRPLAP